MQEIKNGIDRTHLKEDKYDEAIACLREAECLLSDGGITDSTVLVEAACMVYNSLGIYSVNCDMNYENAMKYFLTGYGYSGKNGDWRRQSVLLSNLVLVYNIRKDPSGIDYAKDVYRIGREHGDRQVAGMGAYLCASMFFLGGQTDSADVYLDIALKPEFRGYTDVAMIYKLKAEILYAEGHSHEAEDCFKQALGNMDSISASTYTDVYLCYGEFLMHEGRFKEAANILRMGMDEALRTGNRVNLFKIYSSLSEVCDTMGDKDAALYWYRKFHEESYDVLNIKREREISSLELQYEQEKHAREVSQYELQLMRKKKQSWLLLSILIVIIPVTVCIWVMYRNKDKMYTQIAKSYKQKYAHSSLAKDRNEDLYKQLVDLMENRRVYRRNDINIDVVSEMLHVNRTYLSQVINGQAGVSFSTFVNSYRIQDAVKTLSDPDDNTPLKALAAEVGFNSISLFYKLFREKVGVPPAKFREKIIMLSKENN